MEPFISQISMFGFEFAPRAWAQCDGQFLPITENQALFALIGTAFGGDGRTTLRLPELRGRVPIHQSPQAGLQVGISGGQETVSLSIDNLPQHNHALQASAQPGSTNEPQNLALAMSPGANPIYGIANNLTSTAERTLTQTGDSNPHNNVQPSQVINFCIALAGMFPSRS